MLLHLPIVIMASLSPMPVADAIPQLDVAKECRFEGGTSEIYDRCMRDENEALEELRTTWTKVGAADRASCTAEATNGGYASYIELLTCLEMARDLAQAKEREDNPRASSDTQPAQTAEPVGDRPR